MKTLRIFTMFALSCALLSCGNEKNGDISQLSSPKVGSSANPCVMICD